MPIFIKTEFIKKKYLFQNEIRVKVIAEHINWVKNLIKKGINIKSGYLVDESKKPGGGGLLILEINSYNNALEIIRSDPMIKNNIVDWKLNEWIDINR